MDLRNKKWWIIAHVHRDTNVYEFFDVEPGEYELSVAWGPVELVTPLIFYGLTRKIRITKQEQVLDFNVTKADIFPKKSKNPEEQREAPPAQQHEKEKENR